MIEVTRLHANEPPPWVNLALPLACATHKLIPKQCHNHTIANNCFLQCIPSKVITHLYHKTFIFGQHMFGKHKHKYPLSFDIVKDLQTCCLQDF